MGSHDTMHAYHLRRLENGQDEYDGARATSGLKIIASLGLKDGSGGPATVEQEIRNGERPESQSSILTRPSWSGSGEVLGVVSIGNVSEFQIFVRDFQGKSITFTVNKGHTVEQLMRAIENRIGVAECQQRLHYGGQELQKGNRLDSYGIHAGSTLHLTGRLRGGGSLLFQTLSKRLRFSE